MKRRNFLTNLVLATGTVLGGARCRRAVENRMDSQNENLNQPFKNPQVVIEPAREIPVIETTDVLVIGGGPAGIAAAISASRAGVKTTLVERYNHLGGLWTGGLVLPLLSTHAIDKKGKHRQVIFGISDEIADKLASLGMAIHEVNPVVDPEATKFVLEEMIQQAGVEMLYHCWASNVIIENNLIKAVIIESKSGRVAIIPKVVIDCTGDGDILHLAGENYENMYYHIGLVHRLGNVDRIDKTKMGFKTMEIGNPTPIPAVNWVNMHGEDDQNGIDLYTLSRLQQKYRIQIWENFEKIRATPGYESVFLLDTASQLGVRMSRILDGEYRLTLEDSMTFKKFDDVIGISGAWTNILYKGRKIAVNERPLWQIPYRSLIPKKTQNLLVAGRCFCFEKALVEDTRIIGTCLVTGHGAGAAASVAVKNNTFVKEIDIEQAQKILKEQNAFLG
ncbi:FAD-dependent oxidoreductase [candidate division KSB1 bacterium]|nr:FAD-dependent oxidoreductase [candidate division KSB1 bacterium]